MKSKKARRQKGVAIADRIVAVIDTETDPFLYGRIPAPFVAAYYEWGTYREFWGADCMDQLVDYLRSLKEPRLIYAHNGGKFDFFFMLRYLDNPLKIINGRIAKASCGIHELRDSYAAIPIPLAAYQKTTFDYAKMEPEVRHLHKDEISLYLKDDCINLHELITGFIAKFGVRLTIGGAAIRELAQRHDFERTGAAHDGRFRKYYFGGRVECIESGVISGNWRVFDVNSMYPDVMRNCMHPTGREYRTVYGAIMDKKGRISGLADYPVYFATIECWQDRAFPFRTKDALSFFTGRGVFDVTSHEVYAAIETGRIRDVKVIEAHAPESVQSFVDFVDEFMAEKIAAKKSKDKLAEIFAKLILNSAYGKFGTNPANYRDYMIVKPEDDLPPEGWQVDIVREGGLTIWKKPSSASMFYDVATAASITGAARAKLLRALSAAVRPVYCDTDSIICESLPLEHSETALGAWKLEAQGDTIAIAGKKLYALRQNGKFVKGASKGAILTDSDIWAIARGESVHWKSDAPAFSLGNQPRFVDRKIQSTIAKKAR